MLGSAKSNLKLRYSLLKHLYFLFMSKRGIGTIWRPLFFDYPKDTNSYLPEVADTQFLIGANLMAAPILEKGSTERTVYFPGSNWVNLHTGKKYTPGTHLLTDIQLTDLLPVFVREGGLVGTQDTKNVVNTQQLDNVFLLSMPLALSAHRSNATQQVYESVGGLLSIKDFNDESLVSQCVKSGCEYILTAVATISSHARTL